MGVHFTGDKEEIQKEGEAISPHISYPIPIWRILSDFCKSNYLDIDTLLEFKVNNPLININDSFEFLRKGPEDIWIKYELKKIYTESAEEIVYSYMIYAIVIYRYQFRYWGGQG